LRIEAEFFLSSTVLYFILWNATQKPDYMSQSGHPLLSNVYNQNAYFSGNGVRTSSVAAVLKAFPIQRTSETRVETLGEGAFYTVRLSVIRDRADKISQSVESEGSVHSREIGEKKMPNRRVPEQSKVK
jgi:hypothetical protein